ncbi:MAG: dTDP-4-dehydrorhamnose 3,5-epimerase [Pseudomonadales bacterium]
MVVVETTLPGVLIVEPDVFRDDRGFFLETFHARRYREEVGIDLPFVQDNHSRSRKGVLRGMHAQRQNPQGKLIRVSHGEVFDVAADINPASPTFGQWTAVVLSERNAKQLWIPPGYAHGFLVISDTADFEYKCTDYYRPDDEIGFIWNDPDAAIDWPVNEPVVSEKDGRLPTLRQIARQP